MRLLSSTSTALGKLRHMDPRRRLRCTELEDQGPQHVLQLLFHLIAEREEEVDDSSVRIFVKSEVSDDCRG
jgi:hypothetical protein